MRRFVAMVVIVVAVVLAVGLIAQNSVDPGTITPTSKVSWVLPATNADGSPCTDFDRMELVLTAEGKVPTVTSDILKVLPVPAPTTEILATTLFAGMPTDVKYDIWGRFVDLDDNDSPWVQATTEYVDKMPPMPPTGFKITIIVEPITP